MKKIFVVLFGLVFLVTMTACTSDKNLNGDGTESGNSLSTESDSSGTKIDPETWGVYGFYQSFGVFNHDGVLKTYKINTPHYWCPLVAWGTLCEQSDGTSILISGQDEDSPIISSIADVFPAYNEQVVDIFEGAFGLLVHDFVFTFGKNQSVTIGDYDMHTFDGRVTFMDDTTPWDLTFIAYATKLKSNGGYAYWMVFDVTDDHSKGKLIREHAYNMALTFREDE